MDDDTRPGWQATDGTVWVHFRAFREWRGWMPGEDGVWVYSEEEFRRSYPEAPDDA